MKPDDIARSAQQFEPVNAKQIKRDRIADTLNAFGRALPYIVGALVIIVAALSIAHGEPLRGTKNTLRTFEAIRSAE